jgi:protein gp37
MKKSKIEWTEETWNPTIGCDKVSPGCKFCYAETMANRLKAMNVKGYENGFEFSILPERFNQPYRKKKPTKFFVNSMSDLFHEKMPFKILDQIFKVISETSHHTYQILTKRQNIMVEYFKSRAVPENVWLGVSIENKKYGLPRIDALRNINANIKFLSIEPLLEDLGDLNLKGIDWVIVGGESGANARPMSKQWVTNIKDQCIYAKVPFFFKQWGTWGADKIKRNKKKNGRRLSGRLWEQYPDKILKKVS